MRRWNGWGDDAIVYPLPPNSRQFLEARLGPGIPQSDASLQASLAAVPPSRLPALPGLVTAPEERLRRARGQSFPDWVALRGGLVDSFPDGVVCPTTTDEVRTLVALAASQGITLIPYGGGTSVAGHLTPLSDARPILSVDMGRLNGLTHFDGRSGLATFQAGASGPLIEAQLRAHGYTLGHYPQSFEYSTLGGWIATRSSGQQSRHYGRIEGLFAGGAVETPVGRLEMPPFPASAAGPDLREVVLGSEGRIGIITEATVRARPLPEHESFHGIFFPTFEAGMAAAREMVQAGLPLSMLRLSTAIETETNLALAGHPRQIAALEWLLARQGVDREKSLLLLGLTGRKALCRTLWHETVAIARHHGGATTMHGRFGHQWAKGRFRIPYLRNTLWGLGYAVDTVETAVPWERVPAMLAAVEGALRGALAPWGERVHVFTHLSHLYSSGSSLYTTFVFRPAADPRETLARWGRLKAAASEATVANGGTISHQHGVGLDHKPYLPAEKGEVGMAALQALCQHFDPQGVMNPGKLL